MNKTPITEAILTTGTTPAFATSEEEIAYARAAADEFREISAVAEKVALANPTPLGTRTSESLKILEAIFPGNTVSTQKLTKLIPAEMEPDHSELTGGRHSVNYRNAVRVVSRIGTSVTEAISRMRPETKIYFLCQLANVDGASCDYKLAIAAAFVGDTALYGYVHEAATILSDLYPPEGTSQFAFAKTKDAVIGALVEGKTTLEDKEANKVLQEIVEGVRQRQEAAISSNTTKSPVAKVPARRL